MPGAGFLAVLVGVLAVVQARINGELAHRTQDGLLAAVISFGTGLVIVAVIAARPTTRRAVTEALPTQLRRGGGLRWWHLVGGLGGALFVASQGLSVPLLGVALFTVLGVAGTTGASLLVDRWGIGPGGVRRITVPRALAAAGTTVAVAIAVSGRIAVGGLAWWAVVLAVLAGSAIAFQQGVNGQVAMRTGDPLAATLVNFVVGTTALVLAFLAEHLIGSHAWAYPPAPWHEPVLWLGGAIGVVFVVTAARVVRPLGVLLFSLLSIAGQLVGSLVLDIALPTPGTHVGWQLVVGVALTGLAVGVAAARR